MSPHHDVIVLAGGAARRLGGVDKPAIRLTGGRTLLERALACCPDATSRVVVGPPRPCCYDVVWCREEPPGGGPVAAISAALSAALPRKAEDVVVVLAADMPFVGPAVPGLLAAVGGHDGAVLVDAEGMDQPLAGAYRRAALERALAALGPAPGVAVRRLVAGLDLVRVPDATGAATDCDTWADLERVRDRAATEAAGEKAGEKAGKKTGKKTEDRHHAG